MNNRIKNSVIDYDNLPERVRRYFDYIIEDILSDCNYIEKHQMCLITPFGEYAIHLFYYEYPIMYYYCPYGFVKLLEGAYGYTKKEHLKILFDKFRSLLYDRYKDNKDFLMNIENHWVFDR